MGVVEILALINVQKVVPVAVGVIATTVVPISVMVPVQTLAIINVHKIVPVAVGLLAQ